MSVRKHLKMPVEVPELDDGGPIDPKLSNWIVILVGLLARHGDMDLVPDAGHNNVTFYLKDRKIVVPSPSPSIEQKRARRPL